MIKPTVGRVVLYTPQKVEGFPHAVDQLAAIVVYVHSDKLINLTVFDSNGGAYGVCSVDLIQDGDPKPEFGRYAEWMPYQKGQAAKTEQLEAKLAVNQ
jgi:hypothetical protein